MQYRSQKKSVSVETAGGSGEKQKTKVIINLPLDPKQQKYIALGYISSTASS